MIALATVGRGYTRPGTRLQFEITVEAVRHHVRATVVKTPFFNPKRKTATPVLGGRPAVPPPIVRNTPSPTEGDGHRVPPLPLCSSINTTRIFLSITPRQFLPRGTPAKTSTNSN